MVYSNARPIIGRWKTPNGYDYIFLIYFEKLRLHLDENRYIVEAPSHYADGNWHHVVGVADSSNLILKLYVDGNLVATSSYGGSTQIGNSELNIGRNPGATFQVFNGVIDEVRIYNRALSAEEVKILYNITN
jgi:hypothetical protein